MEQCLLTDILRDCGQSGQPLPLYSQGRPLLKETQEYSHTSAKRKSEFHHVDTLVKGAIEVRVERQQRNNSIVVDDWCSIPEVKKSPGTKGGLGNFSVPGFVSRQVCHRRNRAQRSTGTISSSISCWILIICALLHVNLPKIVHWLRSCNNVWQSAPNHRVEEPPSASRIRIGCALAAFSAFRLRHGSSPGACQVECFRLEVPRTTIGHYKELTLALKVYVLGILRYLRSQDPSELLPLVHDLALFPWGHLSFHALALNPAGR